MPTILLFVFGIVRIAIPAAIVLLLAALVYVHHRNQQLERESRQLNSRLVQQQQLDALKTETFATTIHELRSPLTSIRGALVLLSAGAIGALDTRAANLVRIATGNTGRLIHLIDELLDLERMESGTNSLDLQPCDLTVVLAHALDAMSPMAQQSAIDIHTQPSSGTPLLFHGDPLRMEQVLCNLLSNAIKFSPHNSTITLTLHAEPQFVLLRVQDTGRGIPANKLEAIFNRFVRLGPNPSSTRNPDGAGLGLAISRTLVTQHRGTLHAERNDVTQPGHPGTTFILRLPRLMQTPAQGPSPAPRDSLDSLSGTTTDFGEQNRADTRPSL